MHTNLFTRNTVTRFGEKTLISPLRLMTLPCRSVFAANDLISAVSYARLAVNSSDKRNNKSSDEDNNDATDDDI